MGPKYKIGDKLRRHTAFGPYGDDNEFVVIPNIEENRAPFGPEPCLNCSQEGCYEWPTLWAADDSNHAYYHVGECCLESLSNKESV